MVSAPIKILIVDDDEQVLLELERLLESEGYNTTTAWGGGEALAYADQMQFEVLLVDEDLTHPECSGLAEELKHRQPRACFRTLARIIKGRLRTGSTNGSRPR
jgi:CheY-like chemotaxis protein